MRGSIGSPGWGDQQRFWNGQTDRVGDFKIDDLLKLCRKLDRQVGGLGIAQNVIDVTQWVSSRMS
jgi:hypothetical protein